MREYAADARLALLADMYIHWQHDVPYKVADAALVIANEDPRRVITLLCRAGMVRRGVGVAREALRDVTAIELTPAARAELSGYFARVRAEAEDIRRPGATG